MYRGYIDIEKKTLQKCGRLVPYCERKDNINDIVVYNNVLLVRAPGLIAKIMGNEIADYLAKQDAVQSRLSVLTDHQGQVPTFCQLNHWLNY